MQLRSFAILSSVVGTQAFTQTLNQRDVTKVSTTRVYNYAQLATEWAAMNKDSDLSPQAIPAPHAPVPAQPGSGGLQQELPAMNGPSSIPVEAPPGPMTSRRDGHRPPPYGNSNVVVPSSSYMYGARDYALRAINAAEKSSSTSGQWWDMAGTGLGYNEPADHLTSDKHLGVKPAAFGWDLQKLRQILNNDEFDQDLDRLATQALRGHREPWMVDKVTKTGLMVSTNIIQHEGAPANRVTIRIPFRTGPVNSFAQLRHAVLDLFDAAEQAASM